MSVKFSIIGGDLRIIELSKMLARDGNKLHVYGLEKVEELKDDENIIMCRNLQEAVKNSDIIIGPIPFSSNGKEINTPSSDNKILIEELMQYINAKTLIAGSVASEVYDMASKENVEIIDIMKKEELAVLNAISTAEGAIEIAMANTNRIIHGSKVLILGFGRIGKVLAKKMEGLSAKVTCAARKNEDLAWIKSYGYEKININEIGKELSEYDIIINTVPQLILNEENIKYIKDDCLLIDLASKPGGVDQKATDERNLKFIWALALPGKVAPITSAEFIKETIYNILKDDNE